MRFKKAQPLPEELLTALLSCEGIRQLKPVSVETISSVERHVSAVYQIRIQFQRYNALYWVKIYSEKNTSVEAEYKFLLDAYERFLNVSNLSVIKPVAYLRAFNAMVTEHSVGNILAARVKVRVNLFSSYWRSNEVIRDNFYMCGKLLAKLHEEQPHANESYSSEQLLKYIEVRLQKLISLSKLDLELYKRLQRYFEKMKVKLSAVDLVLVKTHGDFAPYNVLVSDNDLVMFDPATGQYFGDLDNYCSQYEDIVHFYRWTQEMFAPFVSRRVRNELSSLFLQGYNENSEHPVSEVSATFEIFMMKYKILSVFDTWPSIISRITNKDTRIKAFEKWFDQIEKGNNE